jgi:hypothetical protein
MIIHDCDGGGRNSAVVMVLRFLRLAWVVAIVSTTALALMD